MSHEDTGGLGHKQRVRRLGARWEHPAIFLALLFPLSLAAQVSQEFSEVHVGAFDADAWNGIVFESKVHEQRVPFAIRIGSKTGTFLDGNRIFDAVSLVGPHAPDGSYSLLGWRHRPRAATITLEWSRIDETTVVGRLKAPEDVQLVLEAYSPGAGDFAGTYSVRPEDGQIDGEHFVDGVFGEAAHFVVAVDRPVVGAGLFSEVTQLQKMMDAGQLASPSKQNGADVVGVQSAVDSHQSHGAAGLQFSASAMSSAHFVAKIGENPAKISEYVHQLLTSGQVDSILDHQAESYAGRRPHITGLFAGAPEAIGNSLFWNSLYVPSLGLEFPSISRNWAHGFGGWVVGEWDCFFGSLLTNVEDSQQTAAGVRAILLAQSPNGVVPNVDAANGISPDRSQPPVGAYIVWKNYARNADIEQLRWAYPRLKKWHEWWLANRGDGQAWRDGNQDGLLEWGSDRGATFSVGGRGFLVQAKWESGMDDSPMYDDVTYNPKTYTMELDDVGLNSLYALDAECLAKIAAILGDEDDHRRFVAEYDRVKSLVRQLLWNEQDGIFENRYWDGRLSKRLSPTNFYPLLAGIATNAQAKRMVREHLLNPKEFWGKYVIPTASRNDPAFQDQYYWRGDIWGPTNYLVYQAINRYGEDEVALEFAEKSYDLFMEDWQAHQRTNEQYYAWGGSAGGDVHYTWGALLCLITMEQFIDENPWDGLRFGALQPRREGQLLGVKWKEHRYDVTIGPALTSVRRDGQARFAANAGVVVRNYGVTSDGLSFSIKTTRTTRIETMETKSGSVSLVVDGGSARHLPVRDGIVAFAVPAGSHSISETWGDRP
ncbi:MAG TPA: trehalase family glycosidase [Steroidobacteraceae bacterium]|nr:trehalase family glycosidase [Steroidobacteraceae bacterium]